MFPKYGPTESCAAKDFRVGDLIGGGNHGHPNGSIIESRQDVGVAASWRLSWTSWRDDDYGQIRSWVGHPDTPDQRMPLLIDDYVIQEVPW